MLHLYFLSFRVPSYAKRSLESIINNASEKIEITVCDNFDPSGSEEIREYIRTLADDGKIKRGLFFENNNIGWSLCQALIDFPPDTSEKFFCLTDGDLIVPDGTDWISKIRQAHDSGAVLTGCSLDMSNYYNTPNGGHDENGFGIWLMGINRELYFRHFSPQRSNVIDFVMRSTFAEHGRVEKLDIPLYHLSWDLWKDDKDYWDFKVKTQGQWCYAGRPMNMAYDLYIGA